MIRKALTWSLHKRFGEKHMSTRSCIARSTGEGTFQGVYHHWDGCPSSLGATLFGLYRQHFKHDLDAMLTFLIEKHPAGWSTINSADFTLPAGYQEAKYRKKRNGDNDYSKPIPLTWSGTMSSELKRNSCMSWSATITTIRYRRQASNSAANTWSEWLAAA